MNGDGKVDLVCTKTNEPAWIPNSGKTYHWYNYWNGVKKWTNNCIQRDSEFKLKDHNGDGKVDQYCKQSNGDVSLGINNGLGRFSNLVSIKS